MSKRFKGKTCAYCAERISESADHVVARKFFPEVYRGNLPKAPACKVCNTEKSILEGTFTAVLPFGSSHEVAVRVLREKVKGRLAKNAPLARFLRAGRMSVVLPGTHGPELTTVLPFQGNEFLRLCSLILRGLVWSQYDYVVPANYYVEAFSVTPHGLRFFDELLQMSPSYRRTAEFAAGAFKYSCTRSADDPGFTAWHVELYDRLGISCNDLGESGRLSICGVTGPAEVRETMKEFAAKQPNQAL